MRKTSLQQIIKNNQSKVNRLVATGLLGTMIVMFSSCDQFLPNNPIDNDTVGIVTDSNGEIIGTEPINTDNVNNSSVYDQRSQLYIDAYNQWSEDWDRGTAEVHEDIDYFQTKGAPFRFLEQQGIISYDMNGNKVAYGNEDFLNNDCLFTRGFVDPKSSENDFYMLVQYCTGTPDQMMSEGGTVATWMLKYTLDDDVYRDMLLLAGDYRGNFLVQAIDQHYTPEVISKSVVSYRLLETLSLTEDFRDAIFRRDKVSAYISNIDYDNLALTIDYQKERGDGTIYSYTYKLKESPGWDQLLEGGRFNEPMSKEDRNALTNDDLMKISDSFLGDRLLSFGVPVYWTMWPGEEQKASATVKYDFSVLSIDSEGRLSADKISRYLSGQIPYEEVNNLTSTYVYNNEKNHSK